MAPHQDRPALSSQQTAQYLERLKIPVGQRMGHVATMAPEDAFEYLSVLQRHHLAEIPFENLTLHYSPHRQISLHPEALFKKIIADNNARGGYCMENNCLFGMLLRSLGYTLFSAGARVFDGGSWTGWSHMVNIVTIGDRKYHVDVGFGGNGPVIPMKLDRSGTVQQHIEPGACRLQWSNIDANTDPDQRLWVYEHQINPGSEFQTTYCFTELEFLPSDYNLVNFYTSTNPKSWFTKVIVGEKKILGQDGRLVGSLVLGNNNLKWRINGEKKEEIEFAAEEDRVRAIEEHFGIKLSQLEQDSIAGLSSEIK